MTNIVYSRLHVVDKMFDYLIGKKYNNKKIELHNSVTLLIKLSTFCLIETKEEDPSTFCLIDTKEKDLILSIRKKWPQWEDVLNWCIPKIEKFPYKSNVLLKIANLSSGSNVLLLNYSCGIIINFYKLFNNEYDADKYITYISDDERELYCACEWSRKILDEVELDHMYIIKNCLPLIKENRMNVGFENWLTKRMS